MTRELPGHKWVLAEDVGDYFEYQCKACHHRTLNGMPLPKYLAEKCLIK